MNKTPNASHIVTTRDMNVGIIIYVNCLNEGNRNITKIEYPMR
jgi:hypothetical protein